MPEKGRMVSSKRTAQVGCEKAPKPRQLPETHRGAQHLHCWVWGDPSPPDPAPHFPFNQQTPLSLQEHEVRSTLRPVNARITNGLDGIPRAVVKACAEQLAGILTKLFNFSLTHATIPSCMKATTTIPQKDWYRQLQWLRTYSPHICRHEVCRVDSVSRSLVPCQPPVWPAALWLAQGLIMSHTCRLTNSFFPWAIWTSTNTIPPHPTNVHSPHQSGPWSE